MPEQLTFDHSLVWEMRARATFPRMKKIPSFIPRNVITRSMGPNPEVQADLEGPFPVQTGDTFLLCSDGLSGQLSDCRIGQILGCLEPGEAAQALVHVANLRGGPDNITVVIARITGPQRTLDSPKQKANFENGNGTPRPVHPIIWGLLGILPSLGGVFALANSKSPWPFSWRVPRRLVPDLPLRSPTGWSSTAARVKGSPPTLCSPTPSSSIGCAICKPAREAAEKILARRLAAHPSAGSRRDGTRDADL